ncbi:MAG: hypothetical protein PHO83_04205 [Geobacteraceae bacterium]|nr:hypothetical protein [Geobacteraceae bacterium]
MRERILLALTGRVSLSLMNLLIIVSGVSCLMEMLPLLANVSNDITQLENITEGYGTILIAYGVATEERATLMEFLRLYPGHRTPAQEATDHVCHHYGLCLLLLGLFVELCEELVKLPDSIMNTHSIESLMFWVAVILIALSTWTLLRFSWLMAFPRRHMSARAGRVA